MNLEIDLDKKYRQVVKRFFEKNPTLPHKIVQEAGKLLVEVDSQRITVMQARQIQLYFKYVDLFEWENGELEDVIFWERPEKFEPIVDDFLKLTRDLAFDLIAPIEARGYLLAGILWGRLKKPILLIRKYKPFFDRFPGVKVPFTNWKGEGDTIFVFRRERYARKRVLVVDDLIETGNSLQASLSALEAVGCQPVGAFYLCDVMSIERRQDFSIPIRSFVDSSIT